MTCLLDTCTFIWLCAEPSRLSDRARAAIDGSGRILLSDASVLEITLKWQAGKLVLPDPPRRWIEAQVTAWSLEGRAIGRQDIYRAGELPDHHRDPFDRLLVAVALNTDATLVTPDAAVQRYPVSTTW